MDYMLFLSPVQLSLPPVLRIKAHQIKRGTFSIFRKCLMHSGCILPIRGRHFHSAGCRIFIIHQPFQRAVGKQLCCPCFELCLQGTPCNHGRSFRHLMQSGNGYLHLSAYVRPVCIEDFRLQRISALFIPVLRIPERTTKHLSR